MNRSGAEFAVMVCFVKGNTAKFGGDLTRTDASAIVTVRGGAAW